MPQHVPSHRLMAVGFFTLTLCLAAAAQAQPFTTIYNVPPDPDVDVFTIADLTQINLYETGSIDSGTSTANILTFVLDHIP